MKNILVNPRSMLAILHDISVAVLAWFFAYLLRFNFDIPPYLVAPMWSSLLWVIGLQMTSFFAFGLYKGVWRFASLPDLIRILKAIVFSATAVVAIIFMFKPEGVIPRSVLILDPILLLVMMAGSRLAYRVWKEHRLYGHAFAMGKPVFLLGAGEAAVALLKDLERSREWRVIGLLDDSKSLQGRQLHGSKVLGQIATLPELAEKLNVEHAIIAMPSAGHQKRQRAALIAGQAGLNVMTVPSFEDLMSGKVNISQIRNVEVEDLLGRDPVELDAQGMHGLIENRTVLVSGAGGSIGSELCRQIIRFKPLQLICLDLSEFALYQLEQEFAVSKLPTKVVYLTGDVKNAVRLNAILGLYKPHVVFHAAAYKHVPMMENANVVEALTNNVRGTFELASACKAAKVEKFVLISTDKAVNPTNVMGASKRLAEMVCQGLQEPHSTRFVIVRFGNVLGSSGSVIPKFRQQIASGGPITVTHPEITRFFMSIPEAAQLVMQAGLMGMGGEIFVLDMGEPVRIVDLAKNMIKLSGLQEDDIEIQYTGLRPGEKLYEELLADDEKTLPTPHEKLRIASARNTDIEWVEELLNWLASCISKDEALIKKELKNWVEEYVGDINAMTHNDANSSIFVSHKVTIH